MKVLTFHELVEILPLGRTKIYRLLKEGKIKAKKVDRKWLVLEESLRDFLEDTDDSH